jgi:hypothetical protein
VFSKQTARKYELEKKHHEKNESTRQLPVDELEIKKREEALSKSTLSSDNKGFNLMLKMGYRPGEALGKASEQSFKLVEPIKVVLKSDRQGLGREEERQKRLKEIKLLSKEFKEKKIRNETELREDYLSRKKTSFQVRKLRHNLHKCQRVCFQLDSTKGVRIHNPFIILIE